MKTGVILDSGKYVINFDDSTGEMKFFRNGEDWPAGNELRHAKVVAALVQRVIELESKPIPNENLTVFAQPLSDPPFFKMDDKPVTPDIEEDLGRMMVEIVAAFDFIKNGPVIDMPTADLDKMFDDKVWKLTPRIQTLVANRVMAKHPFSVLADMEFNGYNGRCNGSERFNIASMNLLQIPVDMREVLNLGRLNTAEGAAINMEALAKMTTSMQIIMNLYGWSWDDIKLKARQQMAKAGV